MSQTTNLLQQLRLLKDVLHWTTSEYSLLERIDQQFATILLESEKNCSIPTAHHWSIELHKKYLIHRYWVTYLRGKKNINVANQLQEILKQVSLSTIQQDNPARHYIKQLQHSRKALIDVQTQSYQHRQVHLNHLQTQRIFSTETLMRHILSDKFNQRRDEKTAGKCSNYSVTAHKHQEE
jgi:hypothetical protein